LKSCQNTNTRNLPINTKASSFYIVEKLVTAWQVNVELIIGKVGNDEVLRKNNGLLRKLNRTFSLMPIKS